MIYDFFLDLPIMVRDPSLRTKFEEGFSQMDDNEQAYLITAFANMAIARDDPKDKGFIERVALDIFSVGFVNEQTVLTMEKEAKNQLIGITTKHPFALSAIVQQLELEKICQATRIETVTRKKL